jgi:hypothetical protein
VVSRAGRDELFGGSAVSRAGMSQEVERNRFSIHVGASLGTTG